MLWHCEEEAGDDGARHSELRYQWYRDGQPVSGATGSSHLLTGLGLDDSGSKFTVKVCNSSGEITSKEILLSVTETGGPDIPLVGDKPAVDGTREAAWDLAPSVPIAKAWGKFGNEPANAADLSATANLLWDEQSLYVFAEVKDAQIMSGTSYARSDGMELFVDIGNDKAAGFGANDYHYHFSSGATSATEVKHSATTGVQVSSKSVGGGYTVEAAIPWTTLGLSAAPSAGTVLGLDLAARGVDVSGELAETYLVWAGRAESEKSPSVWGTARLTAPATAVSRAPRAQATFRPALVSDGQYVVADREVEGRWILVLHSPAGRVIAHTRGVNSVPRLALPGARGTWVAKLSSPSGDCAAVVVR